MAKASRDKGKRGEREVRDILRRHGFACDRDGSETGDLKGDLPPGYHFEVKRHETLALPKWTRQAEEDAAPGEVPIVAYRRNREPWRASLPLDTLIRLLALERDRSEHGDTLPKAA